MKEIILSYAGATVLFIVTMAISLGVMYFSAKQEANAFNRCTGANVTAQEALFAEFRIESCKGYK